MDKSNIVLRLQGILMCKISCISNVKDMHQFIEIAFKIIQRRAKLHVATFLSGRW